MTRWAVIFDDTPAMLAVRGEREPAHFEYLEKHSATIKIAGGLRPAPGAPFVGGMWIVETETYDEVVELVVEDPYYVPEVRRFRIFAWGKAFEDKQVVL